MKSIIRLVFALIVVFVVYKANSQEVKINNNFVVESDGTIRADGAATTWDDVFVPFTQAKQGSNSKPSFDETNVGLLFPYNDNSAIIYMVVQIPHKYKVGSDIYPHIHWQQSISSFPTWSMSYKWFNNNEAVPASFTTITTDTGEFTYSSGNLAQISAFPAITGATNSEGGGLSSTEKGISSVLLIKLWRSANTGPNANILAFQFDIHIEIDTQGSRGEYTK